MLRTCTFMKLLPTLNVSYVVVSAISISTIKIPKLFIINSNGKRFTQNNLISILFKLSMYINKKVSQFNALYGRHETYY